MWPRLLVAVCASACGRIGFDSEDATSDGANTDATCTLGAWSTSERVESLVIANSSTLGAQIAPDGLSIYVGSDNPDTQALDLYSASRTSRTDSFSTPTHLVTLSGATYDHNPTITGDGLELWFSSDRTGVRCLYRTVRATTAAAWPAPTAVPEFCNASGEYDGPYLSSDGLTLVYTTDPPPRRTWSTTRTTRSDSFGPARSLDEIVFPTGWGFASLSSDLLTLYFEVYDNPEQAALWQATRASTSSTFDPPTRMPIDPTGEDVSVTADGRELFFAVGPRGGAREIFVATRACE